MKILKRVLCALLALVMVLGFVGCKNNGGDTRIRSESESEQGV